MGCSVGLGVFWGRDIVSEEHRVVFGGAWLEESWHRLGDVEVVRGAPGREHLEGVC